ncbi:MAG: hypothetical protein ACK52B_00825, partial [Gammaproteobacteria bacterium]
MQDLLLIPFADYWWAYIGFIAALLMVLAFDLGVFSKPGTVPSLRSLFFVLQSMVKAFIFLKYGLGVILV